MFHILTRAQNIAVHKTNKKSGTHGRAPAELVSGIQLINKISQRF